MKIKYLLFLQTKLVNLTRSRKIILWITESVIVIAIVAALIYACLWYKDKKKTDPEFSKPIKEVTLLVGVKIDSDSFNVYRVEYFEGLKKEEVLITRKIEKK